MTLLLGPSSLGCLARPSTQTRRRCLLPLFVLFVGVPSMLGESIGLCGPKEVVDCLGNAWPLKLAMNGATRPKLIWGEFLDFNLYGMVEGTTCKGGLDVSLTRMVSCIGCMWLEGPPCSALVVWGASTMTLPYGKAVFDANEACLDARLEEFIITWHNTGGSKRWRRFGTMSARCMGG